MDLPHIDVKNDESYVNKKCGNLRAATICNSQARATPLCCNKYEYFIFLVFLHVAIVHYCLVCIVVLIIIIVVSIARILSMCDLQ